MKAGILIGHIKNKGNEGAIIRSAEAFGCSLVFVIGNKEKIYNSSEGCDRHMTFLEFKDYNEFIGYAKSNNHKLVCIENLNKSVGIDDIEKYPVNPIFITGNESLGVPEELLKNSDLLIKIPQGLGYANCLNTGVAMGIVLHDFFRKEINKKVELWESPYRKRHTKK